MQNTPQMCFVNIRAFANCHAVDIDLNHRQRRRSWLRADAAARRAMALNLAFPDQTERQPNNCDGLIPISRASAETFAPASQLRAAISALKASDQRWRPATGAPSIRPAIVSIN